MNKRHDLRPGWLVQIKSMWPDDGILEPLLFITSVNRSYTRPQISVMVASGKNLGKEHAVNPLKHEFRVVSK